MGENAAQRGREEGGLPRARSASHPDFIPGKDLRKLVQPTDFGQVRYLSLHFIAKTAGA